MKLLNCQELAADMAQNSAYYQGVFLTVSTIQTYAGVYKLPALQHSIKSGKLIKTDGNWSFLSSEIRQWICFGQNSMAALEVVKRRDYEKIAESFDSESENKLDDFKFIFNTEDIDDNAALIHSVLYEHE